MTLVDGLISGGVVLAVLAGFGYLILAKVIQNNPKAGEFMKDNFGQSLYKKAEPIIDIPDKLQQTYEERRAMM